VLDALRAGCGLTALPTTSTTVAVTDTDAVPEIDNLTLKSAGLPPEMMPAHERVMNAGLLAVIATGYDA
jgi:hypothetical protein